MEPSPSPFRVDATAAVDPPIEENPPQPTENRVPRVPEPTGPAPSISLEQANAILRAALGLPQRTVEDVLRPASPAPSQAPTQPFAVFVCFAIQNLVRNWLISVSHLPRPLAQPAPLQKARVGGRAGSQTGAKGWGRAKDGARGRDGDSTTTPTRPRKEARERGGAQRAP